MSNNTNFKLINLFRSDRGSLCIRLDTAASLETIRRTLQDYNRMTETDLFINKYGISVEKSSERAIRLDEVLKNEHDLSIGDTVRLNNLDGVTIQYFDEMSFDQKSLLLSKKYCDIFCGMTIEHGQFVPTGKELFRFAQNYIPTAVNPNPNFESEELSTFSEVLLSLQYSGAISGSISLNTPWVSSQATYEHAKSHTRSGSKVRSYYTKRFLFYKAHISTDINQMLVEEDFAQAVKNAVLGRERSINGYECLVGVLNSYGWYVPVMYTLGGAIYSTKCSDVNSFEESESDKISFSADVEASFSFIKGGAKFETTVTNETSGKNSKKSDEVTFRQVGGDRFNENNISEWEDSLKNPKYWNIIRYTKFLPSLMLLRGYDNKTLSNALKILIKYNSYAEVKALQENINVQEYENQIAYEINFITGE